MSTSGITICRRGTHGPLLVFLHAGVADLRGWRCQLEHFAPHARALAYDRRGFGGSEPAADPSCDELSDLRECIGEEPSTILVGNSQGGRIAVDFTLRNPGQVSALVLIGPAIGGAPEWDEGALSDAERKLFTQIEQADLSGELDRVNALEAWAWLDGPEQPQGRVGGDARDLFLRMNLQALRAEGVEQPAAPPDAWERISEITAPTLVIDGAFDVSAVRRQSRCLVAGLHDAEHVIIDGCGHLPALEAPDKVNALIETFLRRKGLIGL